MMRNKKSSKGFTLIEILVSLTLLGIIFLLLFSSLYTANKSWIAGEKKISRNDEVRLVAQFLRRQIGQALPIMWINKKEQDLLFDGQEDELRFISTLPSHRGGGGLNLISIKAEQQDEIYNLIIEYKLVNADDSFTTNNDQTENNKSILISHIESIQFSYFGQEEPTQRADWHNEWKDKKNMPQLIRLNIDSSIPGIIWPQIDIAIPVDYIKGQPQFTINSENESPLI